MKASSLFIALSSPRVLSRILIAATLLSGLSLNAQTLVESFQSPLGGLPDGWTLYKGNVDAPNSMAEITQIGDESSIYLALTRARESPSSAPTNWHPTVIYTGSSPANTFADGQGTITVRHGANLGASNKSGIVVRSQSLSWSAVSGYYLTYDGLAVSIYHNPIGHNSHGTLMGTSPLLESLDTDTDYLFHFSFIGSILSATLTTLDDTLIGTVTVDTSHSDFDTLTQYTEGYLGLRIAYSSTNSPTYFKDLTFTQIPEPATAALTMVSLLLLLLWRNRIRAGR